MLLLYVALPESGSSICAHDPMLRAAGPSLPCAPPAFQFSSHGGRLRCAEQGQIYSTSWLAELAEALAAGEQMHV
jgi:hypothetical protein